MLHPPSKGHFNKLSDKVLHFPRSPFCFRRFIFLPGEFCRLVIGWSRQLLSPIMFTWLGDETFGPFIDDVGPPQTVGSFFAAVYAGYTPPYILKTSKWRLLLLLFHRAVFHHRAAVVSNCRVNKTQTAAAVIF